MAELAREPLIEFGDHSYEHPHMAQAARGAHRRGDRPDGGGAGALRQEERRASGRRSASGASASVDVVHEKQLPTVTWDVVSGDPSARTTAAGMITTVLRQARPGSIVVFHINGRGHKTAEALPDIVRELRERGFRFVQVSELLARAGPPLLARRRRKSAAAPAPRRQRQSQPD